MKTEVLVVLCTFQDYEKARQIGAALVERQVAACINLLPGATSIYRRFTHTRASIRFPPAM